MPLAGQYELSPKSEWVLVAITPPRPPTLSRPIVYLLLAVLWPHITPFHACDPILILQPGSNASKMKEQNVLSDVWGSTRSTRCCTRTNTSLVLAVLMGTRGPLIGLIVRATCTIQHGRGYSPVRVMAKLSVLVRPRTDARQDTDTGLALSPSSSR